MGRLVLRIERGGEVVGSWRLDDQPLEMVLHDEQTGEEIGRFVASAPADSHDEVQPPVPSRAPEDDLTMPLPEQSVSVPKPAVESSLDDGPTLVLRRPRNLAEALELAALEDEKSVELELLEDEKSVELELDETVETEADEDERSMELPAPIGVVRQAPRFRGRTAAAGGARSVPRVARPAPPVPPVREVFDGPSLTEELVQAPPPDLSDAPSLTEESPRGSKPRPIWTLGVRPAEVWVLRNNDWISGGRLQPGQRARSRGGWVRLEQNGSLALASGPDLSGTATLPDGRTIPVPMNSEELSFSPGTSVLLRAEHHGIYVRSEAPAAK